MMLWKIGLLDLERGGVRPVDLGAEDVRGSRSGVNWIRWNEVRMVAASVLTAVVLASPAAPR